MGGAEQGIVNGAFSSLNALAKAFSPIFFGALFAGTQSWYEGGNGSAEGVCGSNSAAAQVSDDKCGGDSSVPEWVLGLPWFVASLVILSSVWVLRRLPEEQAPNTDGVDYVPDSAIVLEPTVRQRANTTIGLSSTASASRHVASA